MSEPIPAGVFGKPIISDNVSANLGLAHGRQAHGRDLIKAHDFGGFDAAMAGNDAVNVIEQDGVGETKPPDGIGDLGNLLLGVGTGLVARGFSALTA